MDANQGCRAITYTKQPNLFYFDDEYEIIYNE